MPTRPIMFVLLALAAALTAAPAATPASPSARYLPLADGNRWRLEDDRGGAQTISVGRAASGFVLHGVPGAGDLRVRAVGESIEAWDPADARWEPFLRLGAPAGTTYGVDLSNAPLWRALSVTVASRQVGIEDERGKTLRNCIRLTFATRKPMADAGLEELVFAPGIGFARSSVQTIAGPQQRVLAALRLR